MILIVDHQDSFTRNLEHLLSNFDQVIVQDRRNLEPEVLKNSKLVVLSPGPGKPDDYPETIRLYNSTVGKKPILGVCLGFQLILQEEGFSVIRQSQVLHGVETEIKFSKESATYKDVKFPLKVGRYHSLQVSTCSNKFIKESIKISANDPVRDVPMSFEDLSRNLFGLQYHPESFLTSQGKQIIRNIHHASVESIRRTNRAS